MLTISVPCDQILEKTLSFANSLLQKAPSDEYEFDFGSHGSSYFTPFGMLYISNAIRSFINSHPESKVTAINCNNYYAGHMGYYQACGFDIGKLPGEANGSDRYLPITILPISELEEEAKTEYLEIGEVVERRSKRLSQVLTQQDNGPVVDMLSYSLREMIRNVIEHSQSETVAFCAQYMPTRNTAEIGILDAGIGIRKSLSDNPHLIINSDQDALNLALMPGISGKMFKGIKRGNYDPWQNSGYGLFAVSRLCGLGGKFFIASGDTGVNLKPKGKTYNKTQFTGTAIRLNLCLKDIKHLQTILTQIMKEGDILAKELTGQDHIEASVASRMLSMEFKK
jgi:hypothetical protein